MSKRYLIRLDDACPSMDAENWRRIEMILDNYKIRPMVGIIPANMDPSMVIETPDSNFWNKAHLWVKKGWSIAMHGYNHCYSSSDGLKGLNPMWARSEFAGLPLEEQKKKIRDGIKILRTKGFNPKYFFAPSHTFDKNTIEALRQESDIRIISDSIGRKPYNQDGFLFIPQVVGHCTKIPIPGIWTFCLHPNTMSDRDFAVTEEFIKNNRQYFIGFDDINIDKVSSKPLFDRFLSYVFFRYRKIRGLK